VPRVRHDKHPTDLFKKRKEVVGTPSRIPVHRLPVIVVGGTRTDILHDCPTKRDKTVFIHPWGVSKSAIVMFGFLVLRGKERNTEREETHS